MTKFVTKFHITAALVTAGTAAAMLTTSSAALAQGYVTIPLQLM